MSFVRYRIGQQEQILELDQYFSQHKNQFRNIVLYTGNKFEQGQSQKEPLVTLSILPPSNLKQWDQRHIFFNLRNVIFYSKNKENKIYVYIHCFLNSYGYDNIALNVIMLKSILLNMFLQNNNLMYLNAMLLNNGDVICADSMGGKTTLAYRINYNNKNLKAICDDGILLDIEKRLAYPLPHFWSYEKGFNYFTNKIININKPIQINRMFILRQDNKEYIKEVDEQLDIYNLILMFYSFPFQFRNKAREFQKWIDFRKQLFQQVQLDSKKKCDKISELKFLKLVTSTSRITKRFEILEDKI